MKKIAAALLTLIATTTLAFGAAQEWQKHTSAEGRFTVLLPTDKPEASRTTQNSQHGPYTVNLVTARGAGEIFLVGWVDYDPSHTFDDKAELEANRDNFAKGVKATVLQTTPIKLGAHPGIEFTAESEQAFFRSRVYIVGRRPYQLIAVKGKGRPDSPDVARFFSSFEVAPAR